jgi:iron complex outermembrane recepter protein
MNIRRNPAHRAHRQDKGKSVGRTLETLIAGCSLALVPLLATHDAAAADTSATAPQTVEPQAGLDEIIITARRKSELLQDVPATVTAITAGDLEKYNLQNLKDLGAVVPGLQVVPGGNRSLDGNTFRGVTFNPQSGTQNVLGFYVNDTFVTNNFITNSNFDIGQIEVLSGPQGTLRGEPSPSGSLTITTHKPDLEKFGGYFTGTVTHLGNANGNGAINLPVIPEKLAFRLAALFDADDLDGVKSVNSSQSPYYHTYSGRASVRWEPVDSVEANVMYQHTYWHQNQFPEVYGPGAVGGVNPLAPANYNGPPINGEQRLGVTEYPVTQWDKQDLVTGQLDWHVGGQVVTYDGSYWDYNVNDNGGLENSAANQVPGITAENPIPRKDFQFDTPSIYQTVQTHELRIASETPLWGFMDYTAGGFFKHTQNSVNVVQLATFFPGAFGPPPASDPFIYSADHTLQLAIYSPAAEKETSEFLNLTFHLPLDTELAVGGRHIHYEKRGTLQATLLPEGAFVSAALPASICGLISGLYGNTYPGACDIPATSPLVIGTNTSALPLTQQNLDDNRWIYNASLSHKFTPELLAYVTGGTSWRPPASTVGINNAANDPVLNSLLHLKSETSVNVEVGAKWTFLEDRARLNVSAFHQKFTNFIYTGLPIQYLSDTGSGAPSVATFSFNSNPDAVVNGVNVDTGIRITREWNFDLNAAYANGHLTGSEIPCSPPGGANDPSAFPPGTHIFLCPSNASTSIGPNFTGTAESEYHRLLPGSSTVEGFVRGLYTYYGRNSHASEFITAPAYGILNAFFGLRSADGAWEGAFFAKNALNVKPILTSSLGTPAIDTAGLSGPPNNFGNSGYYNVSTAPRQEFGITGTYKFGSH